MRAKMVYCDGVEVESKLGRLIQAFRCDRPSEWQMDEFIQMAEDMHKEITRLREAERDAARYRWLCEQAWFQVESEWQLILGETETEDDFIICANEKIDQEMKDKGDE